MEGAVAFVIALLAIPFVLPIISWVMARRTRQRVDELESLVQLQDERITQLSLQLTQLRKEVVAPQPAAASAKPAATAPPVVKAPPIVAPPVTPVRPAVPEPPPVVILPPVAAISATTQQKIEPPITTAPPPPVPVAPAPRPAPPQAAAVTTPSTLASPPVPPPPSRPRPPIVPPPEPPEPPAPSWKFDWERLVGVRLFSAVAGIALVFAAVLFLRYSLDQGWLQPPVRVVIGVLVSIALLVVCDLKVARKYAVTANAMDAAAIAILFATFFAARSQWHLISATTAFGLLALVTLVAVLLSIRRDSLFIAVLGLLGGFATPILLSSGENQPIPLFG